MPEDDRFSDQMPDGYRGAYHKAYKHADLGNSIDTLRRWSKIQFQRNACALSQVDGIVSDYRMEVEELFLREGMGADCSSLRSLYSARLDMLAGQQEEIGIVTAACEGARRAIHHLDQPGQPKSDAEREGTELMSREILLRCFLDVRDHKTARLAAEEIARKREKGGLVTPSDLRSHYEERVIPAIMSLFRQLRTKPAGELRLPAQRSNAPVPYDAEKELAVIL